MKVFFRYLILAGLGAACIASPAAGFDQNHARYASVLNQYVRNARVDYAGLKKNRSGLDAYLREIAGLSRETFEGWSREDQLALLINLYNAETLALIVDHYPVASIRDIGILPQAAWRQKRVHLFGEILTLDELEHERIRRNYPNYPEIRFALVCAAVSCPPLRGEPYVGARLKEQLNEQGRRFLGDPTKNRVDPDRRRLYLSKIFDWYAGDFERSGGSVADYVTQFLPEKEAGAVKAGGFRIQYLEYDWSLNRQPDPPR